MARVTVEIEDVVGGAMDGSLSVRYEYEPELDLRGTAAEAAARLSPAQRLALNLKSMIEESHRPLGRRILSPEEAADE